MVDRGCSRLVTEIEDHRLTLHLDPFVTLAMPDINARVKTKLCQDSFKDLKRFCAVPIFTTGISRNRVLMSLDSSMSGLDIVSRRKCLLTIAVVFV